MNIDTSSLPVQLYFPDCLLTPLPQKDQEEDFLIDMYLNE